MGPYDNQKVSETTMGVTRYSELTKYQSVKTCGADKGYIQYTDEQIKLAKKLKNLEAKQQVAAKRTAPGGARNGVNKTAILIDEARK